MNPHDGEVRLRMGELYITEGEWEKALLQYEELLRFDPGNAAVKAKMGVVKYQRDDYEGAARLFRDILQAEPGNIRAREMLALVLEEWGKLDEAAEELRKVLEMEPDGRDSRLRLGIVYRKLERFADAREEFSKVLELTPDDAVAYVQTAIAYEEEGRYDDAEKVLLGALKCSPKAVTSTSISVSSTTRRKTWRKPRPPSGRLSGCRRKTPMPTTTWATFSPTGESGSKSPSNSSEKALELEPENGFFIDSLGWAYFQKGMYREAVTELERAAGIVADDPIIFDHLGDAYLKIDEKGKALESWRKALELDPEDEDLSDALRKKIGDAE